MGSAANCVLRRFATGERSTSSRRVLGSRRELGSSLHVLRARSDHQRSTCGVLGTSGNRRSAFDVLRARARARCGLHVAADGVQSSCASEHVSRSFVRSPCTAGAVRAAARSTVATPAYQQTAYGAPQNAAYGTYPANKAEYVAAPTTTKKKRGACC